MKYATPCGITASASESTARSRLSLAQGRARRSAAYEMRHALRDHVFCIRIHRAIAAVFGAGARPSLGGV